MGEKMIAKKTVQDAIKAMQNLTMVLSITESERESAHMAIEALEKQNPLKPILKEGKSLTHRNNGDRPHEWVMKKWQDWTCPKCGWFVGQRYNGVRNGSEPHPHDQRKSNFCNECGQAIDWKGVSGTNEQ